MKLTASPPPPPEPPDQAGSGQTTPNEPSPPSESLSPPEQPAPTAAPRVATWPQWFLGADVLLVALSLTLAFLVSSFIARNPDLWLHLAAGKRLLAGEYRPGSDPFSYSAADRAWVNHSLLYDIAVYLLYGGEGVVLVVVKALAVLLTFGVLIAIKRPGFAIWPWPTVSAFAILASAPRVHLTPLVGSMLLLAITLFLLFRLPQRPGSWRFPIAIGFTFWVWAQVDSWFFLGPLALALVLLGELIQFRFSQYLPGTSLSPEGDPLVLLPDVRTLSRALAMGLLACMLNPHHVRIWELPFELAGSKIANLDPRIRNALFLGPLNEVYLNNTSVGKNLNGLAYGILLVGGAVILGFGYGRIRIAHLALWVGFAALSLLSVYAIPFFAIVAVPLISAQLNAFSLGAGLTNWGDPKTRLLVLGSAAGRVATVLVLVAACIVAWPGWMQPEHYNPAFNRRVAWGIEPDEDLKRAAVLLQNWREAGKLPPETHGVICSVDLANYCAWFAPLEKVYCNGNYNHHRDELAKFIALRSGFGFFTRVDPNVAQVDEVFASIGVDYLVCAASPADPPLQRLMTPFSSIAVWGEYEHWSPWYLDGRTAMAGWKAAPATRSRALEAIKFDPVEVAFGPRVDLLPPGSTKPIPPAEGWEGEFMHGSDACAPQSDEAIMWQYYRDLAKEKFVAKLNLELVARRLGLLVPAPTKLTLHQLVMEAVTSRLSPRQTQPESLAAFPFLALRAARRAIAADPHHPDGYYALYYALKDPNLTIPEPERVIAQVTALRQCLVRLPPPDRYRPNLYFARPVEVARMLALLYYGQGYAGTVGLPVELPAFRILLENPWNEGVMVLVQENVAGENGQPRPMLRVIPARERRQNQQPKSGLCLRAVDLAHDMVELAIKYAERDPQIESKDMKELDQLKNMKNEFENALSKCNQDMLREKLGRNPKFIDQVRLALRNNLVKEALHLLRDTTDLDRESENNLVEVVLLRIALEMATGRLEDAASDMPDAEKVVDSGPVPPGFPREKLSQLKAARDGQFQLLKFQLYQSEGNYRSAGEIVERQMSLLGEKDPAETPLEAALNTTAFLKTPFIPDIISGFAGLNPFASFAQQIAGGTFRASYGSRQQLLYERRTVISKLFYQRGFLALMEGDIANAKLRFQQSRQSGVEKWGVPDQRNSEAEHFLRLIEMAEKRVN